MLTISMPAPDKLFFFAFQFFIFCDRSSGVCSASDDGEKTTQINMESTYWSYNLIESERAFELFSMCTSSVARSQRGLVSAEWNTRRRRQLENRLNCVSSLKQFRVSHSSADCSLVCLLFHLVWTALKKKARALKLKKIKTKSEETSLARRAQPKQKIHHRLCRFHSRDFCCVVSFPSSSPCTECSARRFESHHLKLFLCFYQVNSSLPRPLRSIAHLPSVVHKAEQQHQRLDSDNSHGNKTTKRRRKRVSLKFSQFPQTLKFEPLKIVVIRNLNVLHRLLAVLARALGFSFVASKRMLITSFFIAFSTSLKNAFDVAFCFSAATTTDDEVV